VTFVICSAGNCDGVHNFCLDCDGSGKTDCPRCDGQGIVMLPERQVTCPSCCGHGCGDCEETGEVSEEREAQ
jgi:hypothetical protein